MGPISEIWFLQDYWQRQTIWSYSINIEDVIFAFAIGGIAFAIYKVFFNLTVETSQSYTQQGWLMIAFPIIILSFLVVFTNFFHVNSIFSSSFSFITIAVLIWFLRPDLIKPSIVSGFLVLFVFVFVYQIIQLIFPSSLLNWCLECNPTGIRFLGINLEELIWDFSWGLVGGVIYEAIRGKEFKKRISETEHPRYSSFIEFNSILDEQYCGLLKSQYGKLMAVSSEKVLSIRIARKLAYMVSKMIQRKISIYWVMILLPLLPQLINLLLHPFVFSCKGISFYWLIYFAFLNYFLLVFPQIAWARVIKISDDVDDILELENNKKNYISWMSRRLNLRVQIVLSIFGGIIGIAAAIIFSSSLAGIVELCIASYISIFITCSFGINAVYWLWSVPLQIQRLNQFPSLRLTWNNPAKTPGIRSQSQLLGLSSILCAFGVVMFIMPIIWAYSSLQQSDNLFTVANIFAFLVCLSTVVFVSVYPQYWLSAIVYREKYRILDKLSNEIYAIYTNSKVEDYSIWPYLESKVNVYQTIYSTSSFTIDIPTLGKYIVAFITLAFPFIIRYIN